MLDPKRLQILREVALQGSFSAAAQVLSFSPSAVSQQVAQLERDTGAKLVERRNTGVIFTPAGRLLISHANAILARMSDAEEELHQLVSGIGGHLRVASFATAASALLPSAIVALHEAHPTIEMTIFEHDPGEGLKALVAGDVDLALILHFDHETPAPHLDGIERIPLLEESMYVLLPLTHRLAGQATVALAELAEESWCDGSSRNTFHTMRRAGLEPTVAFRSDDLGVLQGIVAAGIAICLLPGLALGNVRRDVVIKPIVPDPPRRHVEIAVRADSYRPAGVAAMIDTLQAVTENYCASRTAGAIVELPWCRTGLPPVVGPPASRARPASVAYARTDSGLTAPILAAKPTAPPSPTSLLDPS